jgi:hypothetical protein
VGSWTIHGRSDLLRAKIVLKIRAAWTHGNRLAIFWIAVYRIAIRQGFI